MVSQQWQPKVLFVETLSHASSEDRFSVLEQCSPALILPDLVGGKEAAKEKDFQTLEQRVARARQRRVSVCWVEGVPLVHTSALSEGRRLQGAALPRSHSLAISRKGRPEPCGTGLAK